MRHALHCALHCTLLPALSLHIPLADPSPRADPPPHRFSSFSVHFAALHCTPHTRRATGKEIASLSLPALANPQKKRRPDAHERERADRSKRIAAGLTPFAGPAPAAADAEPAPAPTDRKPPREPARSPEYVSRSATDRVFNMLSAMRPETLLGTFHFPPPAVPECCQVLVMPFRRSMFLGGYYQKKLRNISNSAWYLNANERKGDGSVEEAIWCVTCSAVQCSTAQHSMPCNMHFLSSPLAGGSMHA